MKNWKTCKPRTLVLKAEITTTIRKARKSLYYVMGRTWHMTTGAFAGRIAMIWCYIAFQNGYRKVACCESNTCKAAFKTFESYRVLNVIKTSASEVFLRWARGQICQDATPLGVLPPSLSPAVAPSLSSRDIWRAGVGMCSLWRLRKDFKTTLSVFSQKQEVRL